MPIQYNLEKCATRATDATLLGRLRQRRTGKNEDIQDGCTDSDRTDHQVAEELSRHSVAPLIDVQPGEQEIRPDQPAPDAETPPAPFKADDLAGNEPCPYPDAALAEFAVSHPGLICCPASKPYPWWWRERSWCAEQCKTPCERQIINTISGVIQ